MLYIIRYHYIISYIIYYICIHDYIRNINHYKPSIVNLAILFWSLTHNRLWIDYFWWNIWAALATS